MDQAELLRFVVDALDAGYVADWANRLGLADIWDSIVAGEWPEETG